MDATGFRLQGTRFEHPGDALFVVARHPAEPDSTVAMLYPLSAEAADQAIAKIPHYGRYSYLAFSHGRNRIKGTWDADTSPLVVLFDNEDTPPERGVTP